MASGRNSVLTRYITKVIAQTGDLVIPNDVELFDVTKISGLDAGEESTIDVPDWDRKYKISDGKRDIKDLVLTCKITDTTSGAVTLDTSASYRTLTTLYQNRAGYFPFIQVDIVGRNKKPYFRFEFIDCDIRGLKMDDQEMGSPKFGELIFTFSPADVKLYRPEGYKSVDGACKWEVTKWEQISGGDFNLCTAQGLV